MINKGLMNELQVIHAENMATFAESADIILGRKLTKLEQYCCTRKFIKLLEDSLPGMLSDANNDFECLQAASPTRDTGWPVLDVAVLSRAAARGKWNLPDELQKEVDAVDSKVKKFKAVSKDTHYIPGKINKDKNVLFSVSLL